MEEQKVIELVNEYINKFIPGAYFKGFTNSKLCLGVAGLSKTKGEYIKLSRYMIKIVSDEQIHETIAHEVAHILAYRKFGTLAHDKNFYQMCRVTGARPERLADDKDLIKNIREDSSYCMIVAKDGLVGRITANTYFRKPRKKLKSVYLTNDKKGTLGNLYFCKKEDAIVGKNIDNECFWQ